jgi:hypothetical protein
MRYLKGFTAGSLGPSRTGIFARDDGDFEGSYFPSNFIIASG